MVALFFSFFRSTQLKWLCKTLLKFSPENIRNHYVWKINIMTLKKDFLSHGTFFALFLAQCMQWFGELICFCLLYLFCTFLIIPVFDHSLIWFPQGHCENLTFANFSGWLCSKIVSHLQIFSRLQTNFLFFKCGYWGLFVSFSLLVWKSYHFPYLVLL